MRGAGQPVHVSGHDPIDASCNRSRSKSGSASASCLRMIAIGSIVSRATVSFSSAVLGRSAEDGTVVLYPLGLSSEPVVHHIAGRERSEIAMSCSPAEAIRATTSDLVYRFSNAVPNRSRLSFRIVRHDRF